MNHNIESLDIVTLIYFFQKYIVSEFGVKFIKLNLQKYIMSEIGPPKPSSNNNTVALIFLHTMHLTVFIHSGIKLKEYTCILFLNHFFN